MTRAYSLDLRERVLDAIDGGLSTHKAAKRFDIGVASAVRWHRAWRDHGEREARSSRQCEPLPDEIRRCVWVPVPFSLLAGFPFKDTEQNCDKSRMPSFDSVRGVFVEGGEIYEGSGFGEKTHTQICVRNHNCIKAVFRVPDDHLHS